MKIGYGLTSAAHEPQLSFALAYWPQGTKKGRPRGRPDVTKILTKECSRRSSQSTSERRGSSTPADSRYTARRCPLLAARAQPSRRQSRSAIAPECISRPAQQRQALRSGSPGKPRCLSLPDRKSVV